MKGNTDNSSTYVHVLTNTKLIVSLRVLFEQGFESESSCSLSVL